MEWYQENVQSLYKPYAEKYLRKYWIWGNISTGAHHLKGCHVDFRRQTRIQCVKDRGIQGLLYYEENFIVQKSSKR